MASRKHDFIVSAIVRKMRQGGFKLTYLDGNYQEVSTTKPEVTPKIIHHKPDAIGEKESGVFCIGEAKTKHDIFVQRTKDQIIDCVAIIELNSQSMLIIGIPSSGRKDCEKLLFQLGYSNHKQIQILEIPDKLLPYD